MALVIDDDITSSYDQHTGQSENAPPLKRPEPRSEVTL